MKIFVIKGMLKGMVKLDSKLHFVCDNFSLIEKVILCSGLDIKVVEKCDFEQRLIGAEPDGIVLLDKNDKVLATGSNNGKVDSNKILIQYRNISIKNSDLKKMENAICEDENLEIKANYSSKIDTNLQSEEQITADNSDAVIVENEDSDFLETECEMDKVTMDLSQDVDEIIGDNAQESCDAESKVNINFDTGRSSVNDEEIYLQQDDEITSGVEFIVNSSEQKSFSNNSYFAEIKSDLNKFFDTYPKNEELESKVWGSKWVKIKADYDYSVGVIFEDGKPSIIAYALPYRDYNEVDIEKLKLGEWLQMADNPDDKRGYFIYYQNAQTGEMMLNTEV